MKKRKIIRRTPEQVLRLWVAALRSGKYVQARSQLRRNGGFCCLGVLEDLTVKDGGPRWGAAYGPGVGEAYLRDKTRKFCGLDSWEPALVEMNDSKGLSFKQIADWIEERIPKFVARAKKNGYV